MDRREHFVKEKDKVNWFAAEYQIIQMFKDSHQKMTSKSF